MQKFLRQENLLVRSFLSYLMLHYLRNQSLALKQASVYLITKRCPEPFLEIWNKPEVRFSVIEGYDNRVRLNPRLIFKSPLEFEMEL